MNAGRSRASAGDAEALQPESAAPSRAGAVDHSFTLQAIMDLKGSVGELASTVKSMQATVEKLGSKVEKLDDKLSGVTHKIYAATAVLIVAVSVGAFIVNKAWDLMAMQLARGPMASSVATQPLPQSPSVNLPSLPQPQK